MDVTLALASDARLADIICTSGGRLNIASCTGNYKAGFEMLNANIYILSMSENKITHMQYDNYCWHPPRYSSIVTLQLLLNHLLHRADWCNWLSDCVLLSSSQVLHLLIVSRVCDTIASVGDIRQAKMIDIHNHLFKNVYYLHKPTKYTYVGLPETFRVKAASKKSLMSTELNEHGMHGQPAKCTLTAWLYWLQQHSIWDCQVRLS